MLANIDTLTKRVESLSQQQQASKEAWEKQRREDHAEYQRRHNADMAELKDMLGKPQPKDMDPNLDNTTRPSLTSEWAAKIDAMIEKKMKATNDRWERQLQQLTERSHEKIFDYTSTKMVEVTSRLESRMDERMDTMGERMDTLTQQFAIIPSMMMEIKTMMQYQELPASDRGRHGVLVGAGIQVDENNCDDREKRGLRI